ncbi:MAG: hypothetical protein HOW59_37150 [Nonomuraea sp.]|nr:hypothetical protein [Nonomuraea sp.]NUQ33258.1 hypothetical protein [Dermatophilaceae bacterium]NUR81076.1 hypothetical protein [Dermatophilaceae bacterium]
MNRATNDDIVAAILLTLGGLTVLVGIVWLVHAWIADTKAPLPPRPVRVAARCSAHCIYDATVEALHVDGSIVHVCEGHYAEGVVRGQLVADPEHEVAS